MTRAKISERLPQAFINSIEELLPGEEMPAFLSSFDRGRERSLSFNTSKLGGPGEALRLALGLKERVEWTKASYYSGLELSELTSSPYYAAGLFYLQEASAASPVSHMDLRGGMRVLDLSAAPGGKTLQIACALGPEGFLLSNDISVSRQRATLRNVEKFGLSNVAVSAEEPAKLARLLPSSFDAILVDAPCSGEGMFAKDAAYIDSWDEGAPERFHDLQLRLLEEILPALKEGGYIMYSTCTFNRHENEDLISAFLNGHGDFRAEELSTAPSISQGLLPGTYRIWPHRARGLGHFFCKLARGGCCLADLEAGHASRRDKGRADELAAGLFQSLGAPKLYSKIKETHIYALSSDRLQAISRLAPDLSGLRLLRNSLLLADVTKSSMQPSQQLAMFMRAGDSEKSLRLSADSDALRRYLLGETLLQELEEGPVLLALDDYGLGFAKSDGKKLKNLYKKDWIKCLRT